MSRTHRSQQEWLTLIDEFEQSDQTQTAFCTGRGLNPKYFSLKRAELTRSAVGSSASMQSSFVRLSESVPTNSIRLRVGASCLELPVDYPLDALSHLLHSVA